MNNNKKEISDESRKTNYQVRELEKKDLEPVFGFLKTLSDLAEVGNLSQEKTEEVLEIINAQGSRIFIAVSDEGQIIGSLTLMLEQKFLRSGKIAGHIEDVVTRKGYEGLGIASTLMKKATETARESGCYKLILDCEEGLVSFYEKFNFKKQGVFMKIYLRD